MGTEYPRSKSLPTAELQIGIRTGQESPEPPGMRQHRILWKCLEFHDGRPPLFPQLDWKTGIGQVSTAKDPFLGPVNCELVAGGQVKTAQFESMDPVALV